MQLSIITINRNNSAGLKKTIASVLSQSWINYEYIIIDGASTDSSVEVTRNEIENASPTLRSNIQFISEADTGVFNAMNKGITKAKGDYLLFLNSGDFFVDSKVLETVFKENNHEKDIICCRCRISKNGQQVFITTPPSNFTFGFFYKNSLPHQATFIKKALFDKYGLYREDLKLMSDWEFFVKTIILQSASTHNSTTILTDYNMEGLSSDNTNQQLIEYEKNLIFQNSALKKFAPDYINFYENKNEIAIMQWAWNKKLIRLPITTIYKLIARVKK